MIGFATAATPVGAGEVAARLEGEGATVISITQVGTSGELYVYFRATEHFDTDLLEAEVGRIQLFGGAAWR